jgi:Flp pilus assembly protein TadG
LVLAVISRTRAAERGAVAIEFALVFPLFILLLYGLVTYGLIFGLQHAMTAAAGNGARAAIACDPTDPGGHVECVVERARSAVSASLEWMPGTTRERLLGSDNSRVEVEVQSDATAGAVVRVRIRYPDYRSHPLAPVLSLPGIGAVPPVPDRLSASAVALL